MFTKHTYFGERGSVGTRLLLIETPTVSTLLLVSSTLLLALVLTVTSGRAGRDADCQHSLTISFTFFLALVLTVTNDSADMSTASYPRGRSARLLTGMLAVSTFFSLRRVLFLVLTVIIPSIKLCHFIPDRDARRKRHS
jgi:hypothetical protein